MKIERIWKVAAQKTAAFKAEMRRKGLRQDSPATLMNFFAGYNYFYETEESYGDISEEYACNYAAKNAMIIDLY